MTTSLPLRFQELSTSPYLHTCATLRPCLHLGGRLQSLCLLVYSYIYVEPNYNSCLVSVCRAVLCLVFKYLRVVTGCADGKIRIWNIVTGQCLRILRGNSHSDPISQLTAANNRSVIDVTPLHPLASFLFA